MKDTASRLRALLTGFCLVLVAAVTTAHAQGVESDSRAGSTASESSSRPTQVTRPTDTKASASPRDENSMTRYQDRQAEQAERSRRLGRDGADHQGAARQERRDP